LRQAQAEERREKKPAEPAKQEIFFQDRQSLISAEPSTNDSPPTISDLALARLRARQLRSRTPGGQVA
jgi:hypothetical protein